MAHTDDRYLQAGYIKDPKGIFRNVKGHIAPGQILNPTGCKMSPEKKHFQRLMQDAAFPLFDELFGIATGDDTSPAIKLAAIKEIYDRAWGKAQTTFGDGDGQAYKPQPIIIAQLKELIADDDAIVNAGEELDIEDEE